MAIFPIVEGIGDDNSIQILSISKVLYFRSSVSKTLLNLGLFVFNVIKVDFIMFVYVVIHPYVVKFDLIFLMLLIVYNAWSNLEYLFMLPWF